MSNFTLLNVNIRKVRIRPISSSEQITIGTRIVGLSSSSTVRSEFENVSVQPSAAKVFLHSEERRFGLPTGELSTKAFEVHTALGPETSDDALFSTLGEPLVLNTLEGGRSCVIAYGQTGSGKTHTSRGLVRETTVSISFYRFQ
jgi:Cdc6-like AAA superfamily ATPase